MKGYSPTLTTKENIKEVSSEVKQGFIELGTVNSEQNELGYCEEYIKVKMDN